LLGTVVVMANVVVAMRDADARRYVAVAALGAASAGVFIGSLAWAWATFDFWESVPLVPCVVLSGVLAALAVYGASKRLGAALTLGLFVSALTFMGTLIVTLTRWEG
jgi:hypothetical protein